MASIAASAQESIAKRLTQLIDSSSRCLPRITTDLRDQRVPNALEGCERSGIIKHDAWGQERRDILGQTALELLQHALLGIGPRDRVAFVSEIMVEARDDLGHVKA